MRFQDALQFHAVFLDEESRTLVLFRGVGLSEDRDPEGFWHERVFLIMRPSADILWSALPLAVRTDMPLLSAYICCPRIPQMSILL